MNRSEAIASFTASILAGVAAATGAAQGAPQRSQWNAVLAGSPWVGERPTASSLAGRVVLVDVFTFECINCTRVVPNLKRLRAQYGPKDLAIVGVHAPEVPSYQANLAYVARNVRAQGFTWPVVLDDNLTLWQHYDIDAWPTQLVFDRRGLLRDRIVGDSRDAAVGAAVARLIARATSGSAPGRQA